MYSTVIRPTLLGIGIALALGMAAQAQVFVYPQKGQSQNQQAKDEFECHRWAVQQTGVDQAIQHPKEIEHLIALELFCL